MLTIRTYHYRERLDLIHHIFLVSLDGALYTAPLDTNSIKRCLDFGTGTGIWALDFADAFPSIEVIGTDLSPIQPTSVPPNLRFFVDDVEDDWGYRSDEAFDFIHGRGMGGAIRTGHSSSNASTIISNRADM